MSAVVTEESPGGASRSGGASPRESRSSHMLRWAVFTVLAALLLYVLPLLFNRRFYYIDDSESSAFGQYWEIGNRVLALDWPLVNPQIWQSGNYLAESSWGVYSPVLWLVGVASHAATNAALYVTVVKLCFLVVATLGCFLLARSFGASPAWASVAGVAIPLNGATVYLDAASWANGLMSWCLLPITWWAIRRTVRHGRNPLPAILLACGLVGISYLHATLMLGVVLAGTLLEAGLRRRWDEFWRAFLLSVAAGSMAVVVHLPGLLTSSFSGRTQEITNTGNVTVDMSDLLASAVASGTPYINFMGVEFPGAPLTYIAWFLPLLAFVRWQAFGRHLREELAILVVLAVAALILLGPSDLGVLRFPIRVLPFVTLCLLVLLTVALSRFPTWTRRRLVVALVLVAASGYFSVAAGPKFWKAVALVVVLAAAGVAVVYALASDDRSGLARGLRRLASLVRLRGVPAAVAALVLVTVGVTAAQHAIAWRAPLRDYGMPAAVDGLRGQTDGYVGDVFVVGDVSGSPPDPAVWRETLVGNLWYVDDAPVQNAYSTVYNAEYSAHVCMGYNGATCSDAYRLLFRTQPDTGELLVDLLGISTVQVIKENVPQWVWSRVPSGWSIIEDNDHVRTIVRDTPVPPAGGVVWESEGTAVEVTAETDTSVSLRVDEVPADGGRVALSRIPWPGYAAEGATIAPEALEGFLLTLDIPADAAGTEVSVSFSPPGLAGQVAFGAVIVLVTAGWLLLRLRGRSSRPSRTPSVGAGGNA